MLGRLILIVVGIALRWPRVSLPAFGRIEMWRCSQAWAVFRDAALLGTCSSGYATAQDLFTMCFVWHGN
ncbi:hypothetical protein Nepgr_030105 [Nepenthes gracilis]|uniref:Secreted protein n=1 Tax=Nepenthes gracilis TaxID=150966 RepID=A0AAD3TGL0_NEPGR|nr:hypothetical protein Nepgr_030105 [Nepenthes gracilis]